MNSLLYAAIPAPGRVSSPCVEGDEMEDSVSPGVIDVVVRYFNTSQPAGEACSRRNVHQLHRSISLQRRKGFRRGSRLSMTLSIYP